MTTFKIITLIALAIAVVAVAAAYILPERKYRRKTKDYYATHPLMPPPTDWEKLHKQVTVITDALFMIDSYKIEIANTSDLYTLQAIADYIFARVNKEIDRREEEEKEEDADPDDN